MGSSSPPPVPDPYAVAGAQTESNIATMESSQASTDVNQITPTGALTYYQTGVGPNGVPTYTAVQALSPQEQVLFGEQQGAGGLAGGAAENMLANSFGQYSSPVNLNNMAGGTGNALGQMETSYLNPMFSNQTSQLDTQLRNQGIMPGTPAYEQQMLQTEQNQGNVMQGFAAQMQPQAFSQAQANYNLPLQTASQLESFLNPQGPSLTQTPSASVAPTNVIGSVASAEQANQAAYATQVQQQDAMMQAIAGIAGAGLGAI